MNNPRTHSMHKPAFDESTYQPQAWQVSLMHKGQEHIVRVSRNGVVVHEDEVFKDDTFHSPYTRARKFAGEEVDRILAASGEGVDFHNYITGEITQHPPLT